MEFWTCPGGGLTADVHEVRRNRHPGDIGTGHAAVLAPGGDFGGGGGAPAGMAFGAAAVVSGGGGGHGGDGGGDGAGGH